MQTYNKNPINTIVARNRKVPGDVYTSVLADVILLSLGVKDHHAVIALVVEVFHKVLDIVNSNAVDGLYAGVECVNSVAGPTGYGIEPSTVFLLGFGVVFHHELFDLVEFLRLNLVAHELELFVDNAEHFILHFGLHRERCEHFGVLVAETFHAALCTD